MTMMMSKIRRPARSLTIFVVLGSPACQTEVDDALPLDEFRGGPGAIVILTPQADTTVRTDYGVRSNDNYGCLHFLEVGTSRGGGGIPDGIPGTDGDADAMRALLRFDLASIPASSVQSATLELGLVGYDFGSPSSVYTIDAHRILPTAGLTPWEEGNGYELPGDGTFAPTPAGCVGVDEAEGVAWAGLDANNQAQPAFDATTEGSFVVNQSIHVPGDVFQMDVTGLVNDWLSGAAPNEGLVLRDVTTDGIFRGVGFASRTRELHFPGEDPVEVPGPRLVLTLADGGPTAIEIEADGSESTISWPTQPGSTYSVYRSTSPNFMITDPGVVQVAAGIVGWQYIDDFELDHDDPLDPSDSHDIGVFYRVVEHTLAGADQWFPEVGRVSFGFVPSRIYPFGGYNHRYAKAPLCLTATPEDSTFQQLLLNDATLAGIHWWDALAQSWTSPFGFYDVMELGLGDVLSLRGEVDDAAHPFPLNPDGSHGYADYFEITGRVPPNPDIACGPLVSMLSVGNNAVTWPVSAEPMMASDVLAMTPGAVAIGYWKVVPQQTIYWYPAVPDSPPPTVVPGAASGDFMLEPCSAVYVHIEAGEGSPEGTPDGTLMETGWWPPMCAP